MSLRWDETKILGIEEIDSQHKEIFTRFGTVSDAFQAGSGVAELTELIPFLEEYIRVHFPLEDTYMLKYSYPKTDEQRREHGEFTRDVRELHRCFQQEGLSHELAARTFGKLIRWLIQHTCGHDREMVTYILERMAAEQNAESAQ
jgi:hemerythrin